MKKVSDSGVAPYSGIGLVRAVWPDATHAGSGCLLDSRHILTCAHNVVMRGDSPQAANAYFHPRWNALGWPWTGGIQINTCYCPSQFIEGTGDQSWDMPVGVLSEDVVEPSSPVDVHLHGAEAYLEAGRVALVPRREVGGRRA